MFKCQCFWGPIYFWKKIAIFFSAESKHHNINNHWQQQQQKKGWKYAAPPSSRCLNHRPTQYTTPLANVCSKSWHERMLISEYGLDWKGLYRSPNPNHPAWDNDIFHQTSLFQTPSNLALDIFWLRAITTSLSNLCQALITLSINKFTLYLV